MTASEIIKRLGGAAQLSKALGLPVATGPLRIRAWSHRNAIPGTYWWPIPAGSISGLDPLTNYGVFWKEGAGFSVEVSPATNHMTTGSWIFIGWQATSDAGGGFPSNPTPPGGWGGSGESNVQL